MHRRRSAPNAATMPNIARRTNVWSDSSDCWPQGSGTSKNCQCFSMVAFVLHWNERVGHQTCFQLALFNGAQLPPISSRVISVFLCPMKFSSLTECNSRNDHGIWQLLVKVILRKTLSSLHLTHHHMQQTGRKCSNWLYFCKHRIFTVECTNQWICKSG